MSAIQTACVQYIYFADQIHYALQWLKNTVLGRLCRLRSDKFSQVTSLSTVEQQYLVVSCGNSQDRIFIASLHHTS